eukprot:g2396.t1
MPAPELQLLQPQQWVRVQGKHLRLEQPSQNVFIVARGTVNVVVPAREPRPGDERVEVLAVLPMGSTFGEIGFLTRKTPTAKVIGSSTSIAPKVVGASRKAKAAAGEEDAAAERMGADRKRPQGKLYVIDGEALRRACAAHPKLLPALCTFTGRRIGEAMLAREKYFSAWSRSDIAAYLVRWEENSKFYRNTHVELAAASLGSTGLFVVQGGEVKFGGKSTFLCPPGERFVNNVTQGPGVFDDWQINCSELLAVANISTDKYGRDTVVDTYRAFAQPAKHCPTLRQCDPLEVLNDQNGPGPTCREYDNPSLPLAPPMRFSTGILQCSPCPSGLYSIERGVLRGGNVSNRDMCRRCPPGADCTRGGAMLMAKPDFWGFISADNMTVRFLQCPREYCCHEEGSCEWRGAAACHGNRDPQVPLCGGCLENYSQTIDTNACVENSKCGIRKNPRAVLLYLLWELVYWLCFDLYFLYQAQYKPVQKLLDGVGSKLIRFVRMVRWTVQSYGSSPNRAGHRNGPAAKRKSFSNSGAEAVVFYFYQLAMLIVPEGYSALATKADAALTAVGKFCNVEQPPGTNTGVCIYAGMSGVHKLLIGLLTPVLMAVLLALMRQAFRVRRKETRGLDTHNKRDQEPLQESLLSESSSRLLTVMCSALATTGVETSVGVALVSFVFLLLQMLARPYRLSWVNALQTCSNICLVTLAILNSASGAFLSTGFDPRTDGDATLRHFQTTLERLMVLVLFPPPLAYMWHAVLPNIRWYVCCRYCKRGRQRLPDSQRFIIDLDEESDQESDDEQVGADDEIGRLRRLLAESEAEKEEKERLLAESEAEKEEKERLLAESEAEKEEKERLLVEERAEKEEKERLLAEERAEKQQLEQEKAQLEEHLSAYTDTNGARGFPAVDPRQAPGAA